MSGPVLARLSVVALVACCLSTAIMAQDKKVPKPRRPVKDESSIAEMCSRSMAHKWKTPTRVSRLTMEPVEDENEDEAILTLVEFESGRLGIYMARQRPEQDAWLMIAKKDLNMLIETADRAKSR
jgi:hypothetical protein